jgi:hypothetical protein
MNLMNIVFLQLITLTITTLLIISIHPYTGFGGGIFLWLIISGLTVFGFTHIKIK